MQRLHMDGIVYRRLRGAPVRAPLHLAWRRDETSPAVQPFVDLVGSTKVGHAGR